MNGDGMIIPREGDGLTGYRGEITLSADCKTLFLHDGRTLGGNAVGTGSVTPGGSGTILPNIAAFAVYAGTDTTLYVACHSHEGAGGGWFNLVPDDTTTAADNGMSVRDAQNRLWQRPAETEISPQLYGAWQDANHDDTLAIIAADTYAGANGRQLRLYGGAKYLFAPATEYNWQARHILGDVSGVDMPSAGIWFNPAVALKPGITDVPNDPTNDLMGCFVSTQNGFLVENICVEGNLNTGPQTLATDGYVNPALLPKYSAFAAGFAAFKATAGGTGTFVNCTSARIKVGLLLDSEQGHITWKNCSFGGIFGVYCRKNSGDYYQEGGGLSGSWAGLVFGTTPWAGHNGGMEYSHLRVHVGFSPYGMWQVDDSPVDLTGQILGGLSGCLYSTSWEEVGEAAIEFLPLSLSEVLMTRAATAFAPDFDTAYRPEASLLPAAGSQQYWMKFGIVAGIASIHCAFDASPYSTAANPAALFVNALSPSGFGVDGSTLDAFSSIVYAANDGNAGMPAGVIPKLNETYPALYRGTDKAYKGDLALRRNVLPIQNLLANPETITAALGSVDNLIVANGGNWNPFQGHATGNVLSGWNSGSEFAGFTFPRGFYEELGSNPFIAKFSYATGFTSAGFFINFPAPPTELHRFISASFWIACKGPLAGQSASTRVYLGDNAGNNVYDTTVYPAPLVWQRVRWVGNQNSTGTYNKFNASLNNLATTGAFYIAGLMVNWDELAPYNPNSGPTLIGPPFLDQQTSVTTVGAAGGATALPATPLGYVKVNINGKLVSMPYYNP